MSDYDIVHAKAALEAAQAALLKNQAGYCVQAITYTTKGSGWLVVQAPLVFPVRFTQEPLFTFGSQLTVAPSRSDFQLPVCTVGVTAWVNEPNTTNPKSPFYTGASIYINVQVNPINPSGFVPVPTCTVVHHLRFEGTAMKVLPSRVEGDLSSGDPLDTNTPSYGALLASLRAAQQEEIGVVSGAL